MSLAVRFLDWWGRELSALVPSGLRRALAPGVIRLAAVPSSEGLVLERHDRRVRRLGPLARLGRKKRARLARDAARCRLLPLLAVPQDRVVTREVSLPGAAAEDLAGVLGFEIDRLTPFRARELYYAFRMARTRPETGKIDVALVFAPRADLDPFLEEMRKAGLQAAAIDVLEPTGRLAGLDLLPPAETARTPWTARLSAGLAAAALLLGGAWGWLEWSAAEREAEALRDAVFQARRAAIALARPATPAVAEGAALTAWRRREATPLALETVAHITEILPDDTWLESLTLEDGRVDMSGQSANATDLIRRFEAHPAFTRPEFRAPITRTGDGADGGAERFLLTVALTGGGPE
ncbi:MAG: PilN domain-containing protein [Paracoccaceae bacterium]